MSSIQRKKTQSIISIKDIWGDMDHDKHHGLDNLSLALKTSRNTKQRQSLTVIKQSKDNWILIWHPPSMYLYRGKEKVQLITSWAQRDNGSISLFWAWKPVQPWKDLSLFLSFLLPYKSSGSPRRQMGGEGECPEKGGGRVCGFYCCRGNRV